MTRLHTYSGSGFDPLHPSHRDVSLQDIARGLSNICRFGGQAPRFYSVAQHAVRCADLACRAGLDSRAALFALHHDDAEAYLGDVVRPLKRAVVLRTADGPQPFGSIEARVLHEIHRGLNLGAPSERVEALVAEIDDAVLGAELRGLFAVNHYGGALCDRMAALTAPLAPEDCLLPDAAMALFLRTHSDLSDGGAT